MHFLELKSLSKSYGALKVTNEVSLQLQQGQALGVIGPNGAGKSTLFNLIGGSQRPSAGEIWFQGQNITGQTAAKRCQLGIARSFQIPHPFSGMSVYENLLVAHAFGANSRKDGAEQCLNILQETGLAAKADTPAAALTLLERKRLELARASATEPTLLLLDEIAGGLTEGECNALVATIQNIRARGVSIIWIEHVVHALLAVVDRLVVIDNGSLIADGAPQQVMNSPKVKEIYLGIDLDEQAA